MKDNNSRFKCFLDSNLLVYCIDFNETEKQKFITNFIKNLKNTSDPVISTQSIGEFFNVLTKKLNVTKEQAISLCEYLRRLFPIYEISVDNVFHAIKISSETQYSYWDSLILAVAIDIGCSIVYSEDLTNGQVIEGVKIINPFNKEATTQP